MKISRRNFCLLMAGACCNGGLDSSHPGCLRLQLFVYCFVQRSIRFCGGIRGSPR